MKVNLSKSETFLLFVIVVLFLLIGVLYFMTSECQNNTFVYGAKTVKQQTGVEIECSCYPRYSEKQLASQSFFKQVHFNSTNLYFGEYKPLGE